MTNENSIRFLRMRTAQISLESHDKIRYLFETINIELSNE